LEPGERKWLKSILRKNAAL